MMKWTHVLAILWPLAVNPDLCVGREITTLRECLLSAVEARGDLVAFEGNLLYQTGHVKPYNLNIPVTPVAVTSPETKEQVAAIVKCAADGGYKVQARSGGHSYGNHCIGGTDGAVVIDMKSFQQFSMDESTWEATIGAGSQLDDIDKRLSDAGNRSMAHGACPSIGISGHATTGGLGTMARQFGLALDHILAAEVVLANGSIITASEAEHPDVLFGVKGAGASFGIVTEFRIRTQPDPGRAVWYSYTFGAADTANRANLFKDWQRFISDPDLTRKFMTELTVFPGTIIISGTFFGTREEYESFQIETLFPGFTDSRVILFDDLLGLLGHIAADGVRELVSGPSLSFYAKSLSFTAETFIPSSAVDDVFYYLDNQPSESLVWMIYFDQEGGAVNDIPVDATSYAHRDTMFWLQSYAVSAGQVSETTTDFLDGINNIITRSLPGVEFGAYPGYIDPLLENPRTAYWGPNLRRLEQIKAKIDPKDVFHNPQSVQPAGRA